MLIYSSCVNVFLFFYPLCVMLLLVGMPQIVVFVSVSKRRLICVFVLESTMLIYRHQRSLVFASVFIGWFVCQQQDY